MKTKPMFKPEEWVRPSVRDLKPYSSARDEYVSDGSEMIFLDANENPYENGVNRYPDPLQRSLKAILAEQKGVAVSQIVLGNGSDEILDLIFRAFCEPYQDTVIINPPTYGMYKVLAEINAIDTREVLLTRDFHLDVPLLLDTIDSSTKLIFICSPNNPSGNLIKRRAIEKILKNFDGLVVIDEAYIDFADAESWVRELADYPNLIVTQTLSKAYGMAGIRLGICYASHDICQILNRIKPPYNVNELTQQKAIERVEHNDIVQQEVQKILEQRYELEVALQKLSFVKYTFPSDANFILARVDNATKRYQQLLKKGIVVRNRSTQPRCENTLRFTIGTQEENERLLSVLKTFK